MTISEFKDHEYFEIIKDFNFRYKIMFLIKTKYLYKSYLDFFFKTLINFSTKTKSFYNFFNFFFNLIVEADLRQKKKIIEFGKLFIQHSFKKLINDQNNKVLFICTRDIFKSMKFSAKFKEKKFQTILISKLDSPYKIKNEKSFFDETITFKSYISIYWLTKFLKVKVIYFNCEMFDLHVFKFLHYDSNVLKIADFSDQTWCFLQDRNALEDFFGANKVKLDQHYHKLIIMNFDIIYHNWSPEFSQELKAFFKLNSKDSSKIKHIQHNVVTDRLQNFYTKKKHRNSLVWAGQIVSQNLPESIFPAKSLSNTFYDLSKNNFNVHAFQNPQFSNNLSFAENFTSYFELEKKKLLTLCRSGIDYTELNNTLKKFDFGLILFNSTKLNCHSKIKLKYNIPFKFFSYIESSIPIIVNSEYTYVSHLITKYKIGLSVSHNQINQLEKKVKNCNYDQFKKNIIKFQNKYSFDNFFEKEFFYYKKLI